MSGKLYKGKRLHNGSQVDVLDDGVRIRTLRTYLFHAPGFDWGGGGSGSSELALAIMLDYFGELPTAANLHLGQTRAQAYHQDFKWAFIAPIDTITWEISGVHIRSWIEARDLGLLFGQKVAVGRNG